MHYKSGPIDITSEQLVELYRKHNMKPIRRAFGHQPKDCTCILGVLYVEDNGREAFDKLNTFEDCQPIYRHFGDNIITTPIWSKFDREIDQVLVEEFGEY